MQMVNRNSFVVKPKQPYVDWINARPDQDTPVSLAEIHRDCHTYLIPEMIGEEDAQEYIRAFKLEIFAIELDACMVSRSQCLAQETHSGNVR